mgnify:CR=1 FL=1
MPPFGEKLSAAAHKELERIGVEIKLNAAEQAMLDKSVDSVKGLVEACKGIDPSLA